MLSKQISVCITTNWGGSCPSADLCTYILEDLFIKFDSLRGSPIFISYDLDTVRGEPAFAYYSNLLLLREKYHSLTVLCKVGCRANCYYVHGNLRQGVLDMIKLVSTPYILYLEHDWLLDKSIDFLKIVDVFERHPQVNYFQFNKVANLCYTVDAAIPELPCVRTSAFTCNPTIARTSLWRDVFVPALLSAPVPTGVAQEVETAIGDEVAIHSKSCGLYLYGPPGSPPMSTHLEGNGWRRK